MAKRFNVKFRLDGVLVELQGVSGRSPYNYDADNELEGALQNARELCLMRLTKEYKGMKIKHLDGLPQVVGVETSDAWPE